MKILYLGPKSDRVHTFLNNYGLVDNTEEKISPEFISIYDWVVSYGYRHILRQTHIESAKNPIINLHISLLPFNKGASPNYWSWKNDTPKGVTIHQIDEGVDTGDVYVQSVVSFEKSDTLESSYQKLKHTIENDFSEYFEGIINGKIKAVKQDGKGSLQYMKELPEDLNFTNKVGNISDTALEPIKYEDWDILYQWRNNQVVRNNSKNDEPLDQNHHKKYIKSLIESDNRNQYFYVAKSKKLGYIREDRHKDYTELSYVVNPSEHGKGYGIKMMAKYLEFNKGIFICHIKEDNIASIKMAERNGFKLSNKKNKMLEYKINIK